MTILSKPRRSMPESNGVPLLVNGDRMTQPEFHRLYREYDEDEKWELIGGIVYEAPSTLSLGHSDYDGKIGFVFETYCLATPGTHTLHNATTILGEESEPQPDLGLRILPEYGGQSRTSAGTRQPRPCHLRQALAGRPPQAFLVHSSFP